MHFREMGRLVSACNVKLCKFTHICDTITSTNNLLFLFMIQRSNCYVIKWVGTSPSG